MTLPADTPALGRAVLAAYDAAQGKPWAAPDGWEPVAHVTAWGAVLPKIGKEAPFALVFRRGPGTLVVAIRGTGSALDLYQDIKYDPDPFRPHAGDGPSPMVASGFLGLYAGRGPTMAASMQEQLFAHVGGAAEVVVTGHSLGGALAHLFALDVAVSAPDVAVRAVTWASPNVGRGDWLDAYTTRVRDSIAIANQYDLVPGLPPLPGFEASGPVHPLAFRREQHGLDLGREIRSCHALANYVTVATHAVTHDPWEGEFADATEEGVIGRSSAPSDRGAAFVAAVLERLPRRP